MWVLFLLLQAVLILGGLREEQQSGLWSWSKSLLVLGFAAVELALTIVPPTHLDPMSPSFLPVCVTCWTLAFGNILALIVIARRWKLPDGRTSLQAYRDERSRSKRL